MENSAKYIKIAIPVLVGIIILTIGMFVYRSSRDSADITLAESDEVNEFNGQFKDYGGEQNGTQVKELLTLLKENGTTNKDDLTKLPFVWGNYDIENTSNLLDSSGEYVGAIGRSIASGNIRKYCNKIETMKNKINDSGTYRVEFEQDEDGLVEKIFIKTST